MMVALQTQMVGVEMDFLSRLHLLGAADQADLLHAQEMPLRHTLDSFYRDFNFQFPVSGRAPWAQYSPEVGMADAEMGDDAESPTGHGAADDGSN